MPLPTNEQNPQDKWSRESIIQELERRFALEDEVLRGAITRARAESIPTMQVSLLQGKLLQILALSCGARKMLEIGTMTGYSGIWLARSLPSDGKLISLEANPAYAEIARTVFASAGLSDRVEVRVGFALDILPSLVSEAPFDLIFIDADKRNNPHYLDWAIRLSRVGSFIVADNVVRGGRTFQEPPPDESAAGAATYIRKLLDHPRLVSVALPNDDPYNGLDGFAISIVRE